MKRRPALNRPTRSTPGGPLRRTRLGAVEAPQRERNAKHDDAADQYRDWRGAELLEPLRIEMDRAEHGGRVDQPPPVDLRGPDACRDQHRRPADAEDIIW